MGAYFWAFGIVSDSVPLNNCDGKETGEENNGEEERKLFSLSYKNFYVIKDLLGKRVKQLQSL